MTHFLILSHGFNMDGRASSQTITDKVPFLRAKGFELTVLSAVTGLKDADIDHLQLLPWGPSGLRFDLRHLLRLRIGQGALYRVLMFAASLLLLPAIVLERLVLGLQSQWSWALPAFVRGYFFLRRHPSCIVYSTGGAYSAHLAASWLKRWLGVRWIAEIHDPMVRPGEAPKTRDERFQACLETTICTHADHVWWFTNGALASAQRRNPQLEGRGFMVLPGANPPGVQAQYVRGDQMVFAHFGSLSDTRTLAPFFEGLNAFVALHPTCRSTIRVEVYGASLDTESSQVLERTGLKPLVNCMGRLEACAETGLSGRERVVKRMHEVDCLLLMHGMIAECPEYIPSKLYEYFWSRRPVLALTWRNEQLDALVREHGGMVASTDDQEAVVSAIASAYAAWQAGTLDAESQRALPLGVGQAVERILSECL
jgi:hypothetical protein